MSIDDRDYVRAAPEPGGLAIRLPAKWAIVGATAAAFLAQSSVENGAPGDGELFLLSHVALSLDGVLRGEVWQPITYLLLHAGLGHLVLNMSAFFVFATFLTGKVADGPLARLYLLGGVAGAAGCLLWSLAGLGGGELPVVGASGAVTAVVVAAAFLIPGKRVSIVVAELPVWFLAVVWLAWDLVMAVAIALKPGWAGDVAVQAHLGGAAAGALAVRLGMFGPRSARKAAATAPCPDCGKALPRGAAACPRCGWERDGAPAPDPDAARVDALLERIHASGIGSLTDDEREFLNRQASRLRERKR